MNNLKTEYIKKKHRIKNRLKEFERLRKAKDEDIFSELCFCILTPQSKAVYCDEAIKELKRGGLLVKGDKKALRTRLNKVRFPNNKCAYLLAARKLFSNGNGLNIKNKLNPDDIVQTRHWLAENVKGLGYKEASHFLRNIGFGRDVAILDVHILRNLKKYKVIKEIPSSISKKSYMDIENKMRAFSKKINVPMGELDLLFWSNQTGFIFK